MAFYRYKISEFPADADRLRECSAWTKKPEYAFIDPKTPCGAAIIAALKPSKIEDAPAQPKTEAQIRWEQTRISWIEAEQVGRWSLLLSLKNFLKAIASRGLASHRVSLPVLQERILSCHGNSADAPPCPSRAYSEKHKFHYCNDCSCGERELARISEVGSAYDKPIIGEKYLKLHYPKLMCPRQRPGFSNARSGA